MWMHCSNSVNNEPQPMEVDEYYRNQDEPMEVDIIDWTDGCYSSSEPKIIFGSTEPANAFAKKDYSSCFPKINANKDFISKSTKTGIKRGSNKSTYHVSYYPWVEILGSPGVYEPLIDHEHLEKDN